MPYTKREIERLAREAGAKFIAHGARHDIWQTKEGKKFQIPRHERDLSIGVERSILKALKVE